MLDRPLFLSRPRLDRQIAKWLSGAISLAYGGPGTGKSLAIADYFSRSGRPFTSCALVDEVLSPRDFVVGLGDALAVHVRGTSPLSALASELFDTERNVAMALDAWLRAQIPDIGLTIVIDDIRDFRQIELIADLLVTIAERTRDHVRWCFIGRDVSFFPLPSWLANGISSVPLESHALSFNESDAVRLGQLRKSELKPATIRRLVDDLKGWPHAVAWAIEVLDDKAVAALAASNPIPALFQATLSLFDGQDKTKLLETSVLPDLDHRVLHALSSRPADEVARLRSRVPSLFEYRMPLRYRSEVRNELTAMFNGDIGRHQNAMRTAATALESAGRAEAALAVLMTLADGPSVAALLEREGVALADRGAWRIIDQALRFLDRAPVAEVPMILALRATSESSRDHFDTAEAWFRLAIEQSDDTASKSSIAHRFALEAMRRGRPELVESLADIVLSTPQRDAGVELTIRATLATAFAMLDQAARADAEITAVLDLMHGDVPAKDRARIWQQAAFVSSRAERYEATRAYATRAFADASSCNAYNIAAVAQTLLYEVSIEADDDPSEALVHIDEIARFALLAGGVRLHLFALLATFSVHVERGDVPALEGLDRVLRGRELVQYDEFINQTLLPDEAMRAAWSGKFGRASRLVAGSVEQETGSRHFLRLAEHAVYLAAAGNVPEARQAIERALRWETLPFTPRVGRTPSLIALAQLLCGDARAARQTLAHGTSANSGRSPRNEALFACIAALLAWSHGARSASLRDAIADLYAQNLGGCARLIAAIPSNMITRSPLRYR